MGYFADAKGNQLRPTDEVEEEYEKVDDEMREAISMFRTDEISVDDLKLVYQRFVSISQEFRFHMRPEEWRWVQS